MTSFVVVGNGGTVLTSPDGINWTAQWSGTLENLNKVAFGDALFVAVGDDGTIMTSPDAVDWTTQASGTTAKLYSVAAGDGTFCATSDNGFLFTSRDAENWTPRILPTRTAFGNVRYLNGSYFIVGWNNILQSGPGASILMQLTAIAPHPTLTIYAPPNLAMQLQSADDLAGGSWTSRGWLTNEANGHCTFIDLTADPKSHRFYRTLH